MQNFTHIECPSCHSKYSVDSEELKKPRKVKCIDCGYQWLYNQNTDEGYNSKDEKQTLIPENIDDDRGDFDYDTDDTFDENAVDHDVKNNQIDSKKTNEFDDLLDDLDDVNSETEGDDQKDFDDFDDLFAELDDKEEERESKNQDDDIDDFDDLFAELDSDKNNQNNISSNHNTDAEDEDEDQDENDYDDEYDDDLEEEEEEEEEEDDKEDDKEDDGEDGHKDEDNDENDKESDNENTDEDIDNTRSKTYSEESLNNVKNTSDANEESEENEEKSEERSEEDEFEEAKKKLINYSSIGILVILSLLTIFSLGINFYSVLPNGIKSALSIFGVDNLDGLEIVDLKPKIIMNRENSFNIIINGNIANLSQKEKNIPELQITVYNKENESHIYHLKLEKKSLKFKEYQKFDYKIFALNFEPIKIEVKFINGIDKYVRYK